MRTIYPIVEGHGEVRAAPILARRICHEILHRHEVSIHHPFRLPRSKIFPQGDALKRALEYGASKVRQTGNGGGILVLADADDDCPVTANQACKEFVRELGLDVPVSLVLANMEYEAWFIGCGDQLRNHHMVRDDAEAHHAPESIRAAKGYFERYILNTEVTYSETVDQPKFSALMDLALTRDRCRSFRKLVAEIDRLTR